MDFEKAYQMYCYYDEIVKQNAFLSNTETDRAEWNEARLLRKKYLRILEEF